MTALLSSTRSEPIPLGKIEQELTRQLSVGQKAGEAPVRRARMSNLVIFCGSDEQASSVEQALPHIVANHPARVLLLIGDTTNRGQAEVQGLVNVWTTPSVDRICSEQVTLRATGTAVDNLPYAVRGLLIGDLPTNLWWAAPVPPPLVGPLLFDLSERTQQVIYDSFGWTEPARGVVATASWLNQFESGPEHGLWRVASDLNWRRLKYWRRLMSQALDPASAPNALASITEVLVEHGPHAVVQAWELVSWLASRLHWQVAGGSIVPGVEIGWQVTAPHGRLTIRLRRLAVGPSEVRHVRIACNLAGKPDALNFTVEEGDRYLAAKPEGTPGAARTVTLQNDTLPELISRQLSDRQRDPVFRDSMMVAQILAKSVLG
jgi:glucose-6-phosphate dehydrogenase assembly protein OpcA